MSRVHKTAQERKYDAVATSLYDGSGEPRYREGIIAQIAQVLENTYNEGRADGTATGRESALREMLSIARGLQQDANRRVHDLEKELEEHMRRTGVVKAI